VTTKYKKSIEISISKENINNILMRPEVKVLIICEHMKQKPDSYNSDISFKEQQQKIHRNSIIGM
jgi:hypothetical protein